MTQEEIIAGNKLIAEFMGAKLIVNSHYQFPDFTSGEAFRGKLSAPQHMSFNTSWDWLMPVLKQIWWKLEESDGGELIESIEGVLNPDVAIWDFVSADIEAIYAKVLKLINLLYYKEWEESVFERFEANPGLFNYEPTGSPDVENELQLQVREEGEQVEFFQIGYSEEENNFYCNHNDLKGNVIVKQSTNPADLDKWIEEINEYEPS